MRNTRALVFAFDHGVEHGPRDFPEDAIDPRVIIHKVTDAGVDAIMTTLDIASMTYEIWGERVLLIIKLTGKTNLRLDQQRLFAKRF